MRTKQLVFVDVLMFQEPLVHFFTPNAAILFVDVTIQLEMSFIAEQNAILKFSRHTDYFDNHFAPYASAVAKLAFPG